jgi:signal transduction histidine kinase
MIYPVIKNISFSENEERLKIAHPLPRHWLYFITLSLMLVAWIYLVVGAIVFAIRDITFSGERYAFVFTVMILIFLWIMYYLGKLVYRQWSFYTANREILFINPELLIIRRPISIFGITDAYDMQHVRPFFYNDDTNSPAFTYGSRTVFFGNDLPREDAERLMSYINTRFFPEQLYDDEDEDE